MKTSSNVTRKKPPNYITGLKGITNWVFNKNRKKEELEYLIETFKIDNNIVKRFLLYTYNSPHMTWYVNKYLNHLYHFDRFDTVNLIYSFIYLLDVNRISRKAIPESLLYLKNTELADKNKAKIKELFEEFFSRLYDKEYNQKELNFFYDLVNLNIISFDAINKMDKHVNSGKSTLTLEDVAMPNSPKVNNFVLDIYREFSPGIKTFCDQAKQYILSRPECKGCELYGKPTVILDTNMDDGGNIDIMFFGLNPRADDIEIGKPFSGKDGKVLRERMSLIPANTKWAIANVILCQTKTENEIKDLENVKKKCHDLIEGIRDTFPAKIIVPLGAKAADWFGLKGGMASLSGKVFTSNSQTIIPIIHPNAANYNADNLDKFKKDFATILNMFKPQEEQVSVATSFVVPEVKTIEPSFKATGDKFVTTVTPDLTFFDVREVDGKILMIYINQQGQKRYKVEDYNLHFYLKNDNWRNCNQVTDRVDGIVTITGKEKGQAIKIVRDKLNLIKSGR
jgi:uracil-DNA glycosylase family 4